MSRRLCEPLTQVRVIRGVPRRFHWRDRRYEVRAVLACWVEVGPWWRVEECTPGVSGVHESTYWRVEATTGRSVVCVVDLSVAADSWLLTRVID